MSFMCLVALGWHYNHLVEEEVASFFAFLWFLACILSILVCLVLLLVSLVALSVHLLCYIYC